MDEYNEILQELKTDPIAKAVIKKYYGQPLDVIYYRIEYEYAKYTSTLLFPNNIVLFYPSYKEYKAKNIYYSTLEEYMISKGESYIYYSGLFINLSTNNKYILSKPIRYTLGEEIPKTLVELEDQFRFDEDKINIQRIRNKQ
jgi:hypothetical protein